MHREDHNTKLSMNVRPSLTSFHPLLSFSVLFCLFFLLFLYPSFCFSCSSSSLTPFSFTLLCILLSFCCPADSNVGTTSLQLASLATRGHRNIERTFLGPHVCASVCPFSSSSSTCSPPTAAQMRLGCTDSANFLSDGMDDFVFHLMQLTYNFVQNFLFHPIKFCVCFTSATDGSHSGYK